MSSKRGGRSTEHLRVIYDDDDDLSPAEYRALRRYNKKHRKGKLWWWILIPAILFCLVFIVILWPKEDKELLSAEHALPSVTPELILEEITGWEAVPDAAESTVIPTLGNHVLFLEKRSGMRLSIVSVDEETKVVTLCLEGLKTSAYDSSYLKCVSDGKYYNGKNQIVAAEHPIISDCSFSMEELTNRTFTATIRLQATGDYSWGLYEDEHYFFINALEK